MTDGTDANDRTESDAVGDDTQPVLSPFENVESDDRSDYAGDRLRNRLGISIERWELLVSVVTFLPYPVFVALILTNTVDSLAFLLFTLAYSVFAMYVNLVL